MASRHLLFIFDCHDGSAKPVTHFFSEREAATGEDGAGSADSGAEATETADREAEATSAGGSASRKSNELAPPSWEDIASLPITVTGKTTVPGGKCTQRQLVQKGLKCFEGIAPFCHIIICKFTHMHVC